MWPRRQSERGLWLAVDGGAAAVSLPNTVFAFACVIQLADLRAVWNQDGASPGALVPIFSELYI